MMSFSPFLIITPSYSICHLLIFLYAILMFSSSFGIFQSILIQTILSVSALFSPLRTSLGYIFDILDSFHLFQVSLVFFVFFFLLLLLYNLNETVFADFTKWLHLQLVKFSLSHSSKFIILVTVLSLKISIWFISIFIFLSIFTFWWDLQFI